MRHPDDIGEAMMPVLHRAFVGLMSCAVALGSAAQLPSPRRVADLMAAFPQLQKSIHSDQSYIRDPFIRLRGPKLKEETDWTTALEGLAAREAVRALADSDLLQAKARERQAQRELERATMETDAATARLKRLLETAAVGDKKELADAVEAAQAALQRANIAMATAQARIDPARNGRTAAEGAA